MLAKQNRPAWQGGQAASREIIQSTSGGYDQQSYNGGGRDRERNDNLPQSEMCAKRKASRPILIGSLHLTERETGLEPATICLEEKHSDGSLCPIRIFALKITPFRVHLDCF